MTNVIQLARNKVKPSVKRFSRYFFLTYKNYVSTERGPLYGLRDRNLTSYIKFNYISSIFTIKI